MSRICLINISRARTGCSHFHASDLIGITHKLSSISANGAAACAPRAVICSTGKMAESGKQRVPIEQCGCHRQTALANDPDFSFLLFKRIPLIHPRASAETAIASEKMFSAIAETILRDAETLKANAKTLKGNAKTLKANAEALKADAKTLKANAEGLKADAEALKAEPKIISGAAKIISGEAKIISAQATISFSPAFTAFPANLPVTVEFLRSD